MRFLKSLTLGLGLSALLASAYIIKEGDTLWGISDEYLGNPYLWEDLWQKNQDNLRSGNPHLIYPGEEIDVNDSGKVSPKPYSKNPCATSVADTNLPKGITAVGCDQGDARDSQFEKMLGNLREKDNKGKKKKKENDAYYYNQRPAPKTFNAYYQILAPEIYTLDSLKNDSNFFSIKSGEKKEPLIHLPESEVVVGIGKKTNENLKVGDLVEIIDARSIEVPASQGKSFNSYALLRLSGLAKITAIGDTLSRAQVVQSFHEIKISQSKARLKKPLAPINVSGYTNEKQVYLDSLAIIRYAIDPMLIVGTYSYVLIDKGSAQQYNTGDAIAVWEEDKSDASIPPRLLGRGIIARASENEASVLIREIYSNNRRIEMGHKVSVTHRANIVK